MKVTRQKLNNIITKHLFLETSGFLFEVKGDVQAIKKMIGNLEGEHINEAESAILIKGIERMLEKGSDIFIKSLAASPKALSILEKHVPTLGPLGIKALGMFGAFSIVSGIFSVLPAMINRTLDNLSSIEGSFLNFYRLKNIQQIGTDKPQEPITWDEYGDSTGAEAVVVDNFGVKIRTKKELAMILAASKLTGNPDNDIMLKIEKAGHRKYGRQKGYERIFDISFYNEVGKIVKQLRKIDNSDIPHKVFYEIAQAVQYKDNQKLSAFAAMFDAIT